MKAKDRGVVALRVHATFGQFVPFEPFGEVAEHLPAGARVVERAYAPDGRAQALDASVGMHDRALLLGVRLGWEHHSRVCAQAIREQGRVRHEYGEVILPLTVLRRLDAVMTPTRQAVWDRDAALTIQNKDRPLKLAAKLPQIVNFGAYPTSIYLGRDGKVRSVHAGFASEATGEEHLRLEREITDLVEKLLAEKTAQGD